MIIRRYSEKDAPMDVQYKKYLTSLARMIDPKDPIYFEFKNGKVFVEQRLYAAYEPKIELDRKLRYIYNKHILMWQPEFSVDENKIKAEFRNFISGFISDSFVNIFNQTLQLTNDLFDKYEYCILSNGAIVGKICMQPTTEHIRIYAIICNKGYAEDLIWEYGKNYTYRNLWQFIIRALRATLCSDNWKFI